HQVQMDWGICSYVDDNGIVHKVPAFAMIMGSSRAKYIEFTKRCDIYSIHIFTRMKIILFLDYL
ncbi:MAG: hypothetical protein VB122_01660, partial [Erysipelotrichales bacterium]|nr:hypothetical protein [Erysipelotrichales bacterium]